MSSLHGQVPKATVTNKVRENTTPAEFSGFHAWHAASVLTLYISAFVFTYEEQYVGHYTVTLF